MISYILRRILIMPVLLLGTTLLIFAMLQFLSPIERSALYVRSTPKNPAALDGIIKRYGLADPLYLQYWHWLAGRRDPQTGQMVGGVLRGELGYSRVGSQPVADLIRQKFPATVELALWTFIPMIGVGIWLGVQAAAHQNKLIDQVALIFSIIGYSFPTFVFGLLMLMLFYAELRWFPPGRLSDWAQAVVNSADFRSYTHLITLDALLNLRFRVFVDALRHLVLPVATLCYVEWALFVRVTRSAMLESLRQEYVTTARAKGLPEREVINRHALRNALIPVSTLASLTVAGLLGGVVIVETVFNYPGLGQAAAAAAAQLDVVTVLGFALFDGVILILANLATDIMYGFIDPRVRLQ